MENNKKFGNTNGGSREYQGGERPRRPRISTGARTASSSQQHENRPYGEHKPYGENKPYGERRQFSGEHKPYGDRKQYGENKPYGERKQFSGEHKPYGERRQYGENKPYGERRQYGESKPYGERRQYGENKPYGERRQFSGEHKPYGERRQYSESKPYGERKQYGESKPYGERRSFGDRKPYGERRPYGDRKPYNREGRSAADEGINRMISDRPQLNADLYSDNDNVKTPIKDSQRLNKFIANSGICSRREADQYIQAGVVTVNGEIVTELGVKINPITDDVRFNGQRLRGEEKVYIVMNKPKGYVTTAADPHADKTVMELLKDCNARVFAVGRLDKNTTGVLMFTNDGEMAERLTHPSYDKKKIYQVTLDHDLKQEDFDKILSGITLNDGDIAADDLQYIDENDHRKLGIEIHSGKNRIVRRIFESLDYDVKALDRVYFAGLTKKGLTRGGWRYLTEGEVNILKMGAYR